MAANNMKVLLYAIIAVGILFFDRIFNYIGISISWEFLILLYIFVSIPISITLFNGFLVSFNKRSIPSMPFFRHLCLWDSKSLSGYKIYGTVMLVSAVVLLVTPCVALYVFLS